MNSVAHLEPKDLQAEFDRLVEEAQEFMHIWLEAGLDLQTVLTRTHEYVLMRCGATAHWSSSNWLLSAKVINQAAKNLQLDTESQLKRKENNYGT